MKIPIIERVRRRLFVKILLVVALALTFVIALIRPVQHFFFEREVAPIILQNLVHHSQYIKKDLGTPPNYEKAKQLGDQLSIKISYSSPDGNWTTHTDMTGLDDIKMKAYDKEKGIYYDRTEQGPRFEFREDNRRLILVYSAPTRKLRHLLQWLMIAFGLLATLAILGVYVAVNWLLKPIKHLHEGVEQLSEGNIEYQMMTNRSDELGELMNSFNVMTRRIREMLQAREQLLQDVSHELRSPLTRVKVALEFMDESTSKLSIREDISEMETMITELLETDRMKSRFGSLELTPVNLAKLVKETATELEDQKPGIKLVSFPEEINLQLDFKRIRILVRNIIGNALRYSEPGGYPVEVSLREKKDEVIISVQNFGTGIPEQDLPFVFEPFYRVDKSRSKKTGGYGLGLSLCKRIMEAHGGKIEITSRIDVGTTVFLKFIK